MTGEGFLLRHLGLQRHDSMYLLLPLVMCFLYRLLLAWPAKAPAACRTLSTWVYILHPAMLVVLRGGAKVVGLTEILVGNSLVQYLMVCLLSFLAAGVVTWVLGRLRPQVPQLGRAWVQLDRAALVHNVAALRALLPPGCQLMPAVKADAYGHGALPVARILQGEGVSAFCVACLSEGIQLRKGGIRGEILILGYTHPDQFPLLRRYRLSQTVVDAAYARQLAAYGRPLSVHLAVDTGMHRLGEASGHYNFKEKEFYWRVRSDFDYWPRKRAALHLEFGNGNRIYSSDVLDDLKAIPDSIFDFNQIHLDYFKDLYLNLRHSWEIVNGLSLEVGVSMHRRTEVNRSRFELNYPSMPPTKSATRAGSGGSSFFPNFDPNILNKFRHTYNSFAPRVRLTWTPGQYYYMNGDRKVNLHSKYPSISVDWERGLSGVLQSSGSYERVEIDLQHQVSLGLMRDIYWRFGWGEFTNQKELYFVDFANLRRSNLPMGWSDDIGGVFQLLDGRWYNSSRKYIRGHLTYEAPFLLLRHLMKYTQYVLNERLYLNALVVPHLKPYLEVGYGIGTHIFDFGLFASFANWKYQEIGCKFTFELFNR